MIRYYWHIFVTLSHQDQILFILTLSILLLFIFVVFLAFSTFYFRARNNRKSRKYYRLERVWEPLLLEILSDE